MAPPASYGVFVSSSVVAGHDRDAIRKLCFGTTTGREHRFRQLDEEGRRATNPESFEALEKIGKKASKYMGINPRQAPAYDRSQCMYSTQFQAPDPGATTVSKLMAERNNPKYRPAPAKPPAETGKTMYGHDYADVGIDSRLRAKLPNQHPGHGSELRSTQGLLELRSSSHLHHQLPDRDAAERLMSRTVLPVHNLSRCTEPPPAHLLRSEYGTTFTHGKAPLSTSERRTLLLSQSMPNFRATR